MSETPVGQQVSRRTCPQTCDKIDVGNTLCQRPPNHGFLSKTTFKECFANAGAKRYVSNRIQNCYPFVANLYASIKITIPSKLVYIFLLYFASHSGR